MGMLLNARGMLPFLFPAHRTIPATVRATSIASQDTDVFVPRYILRRFRIEMLSVELSIQSYSFRQFFPDGKGFLFGVSTLISLSELDLQAFSSS
jgi:hypothetical protein